MPADVTVDRVSKRYRIGGRGGILSWRPLRTTAAPEGPREFWALRDVSFDVRRGETLGVIGQNGAGKSTLLKLLSGISAPTAGEIVIHGRISALIEVGSGFHPELTGRENVFLSGSILGMRRREIEEKLPRIVEFSGVGPFLDTPVKWYSSGMYVRLGFSIAAHLQPDILLVDEVLAVGDAEFQARCLQRIGEMRRQGATIIFISHDLTTVERLCDRVLLLERGRLVASGAPADVTAEYHRRMTEIAAGSEPPGSRRAGDRSPGAVELTGLTFHDAGGGAAPSFRTGAPLRVQLRFVAARPLSDLVFDLAYYSQDGRFLYSQCTTGISPDPIDVEAGPGIIEFTCPELGLQPGVYYVGATVRMRAASFNLHWWDGGTMLYVEPGPAGQGQFHMPHSWRVLAPEGVRSGAPAPPGLTGPTGRR